VIINPYILLIILTFFGAAGSFFFKKSARNSPQLHDVIRDVNLYLGAGFYIISAIINIIVLQLLPYTIVLPCSSITYVWSLFLSRTYLRERIGFMKIVGVICIIIGTLIIPLSLA
jgi:drug/metabolite transporter (DMT)-like permease